MMRLGGCAAETACDSSLYFALHRSVSGIYPFDTENLTKEDYLDFARVMERYIWPRAGGVDRLDIFTVGYGKYLRDRGIDSITMGTLDGSEPYEAAADSVMAQIDTGYPIPTLILQHRDKKYKEYIWHWFLINGYEMREDGHLMVKAVTYSNFEWLDLKGLWNTGYARRGGLVLFSQAQETGGASASAEK